ncbi:MAG: hypothetical protein VX899_27550 [Myxococcota bacterium]|nr:hypothetical protein [Myxococcota bacterium]
MSTLLTLFSLLLAADPAPAVAQDDEAAEEDDEFDFLKEGDEAAKRKAAEELDEDTFELEEDDDFNFSVKAPAPKAAPASAATAAGKLPETIGKDALADSYAPQLSSPAAGVVVLELPILVARAPSDFDGRAYWLVTEVYADGMKVGATRNEVRRETLASAGPSFVFVKLQVPVPDATGELEIRVGKATASGGQPQPLFVRKAAYKTQ